MEFVSWREAKFWLGPKIPPHWKVSAYFCFTLCDWVICFAFTANFSSLSYTWVPWTTFPPHSITIFLPHCSPCHGIFWLGLPTPPSLLAQFVFFWHVKSSTRATIEDHCQVEGGGGKGVILDSIPVCSHHSLGSSDWEVSSRPFKLKIVSQSDVLKGTVNPLPSWAGSFFIKIRHSHFQEVHSAVAFV